MIIYAVDDEPLGLRMLTRAIEEAVPDCELHTFTCGKDLLAELQHTTPDVAFLDIELPDVGELELAHGIKEKTPRCNIVFVTGFSKYAQEAFATRPSGYVMKPASKEKILTELANLRNPPKSTMQQSRIRVQCFGNFEIFADGIPVQFTRSKSKELLAYLVDRRGATCSAAQIAAVLWDDGIYNRSRQKQFSNLRGEMLKSLKRVGAEQIISHSHDALAVLPQTFACDYYTALAGDMVTLNAFNGEYMSAYSWAEFTAATMNSKAPK